MESWKIPSKLHGVRFDVFDRQSTDSARRIKDSHRYLNLLDASTVFDEHDVLASVAGCTTKNDHL